MSLAYVAIAIICVAVVAKGFLEGADNIFQAIIFGICFYTLFQIIVFAVMNI